MALVIDRFDLRMTGPYRGFEDSAYCTPQDRENIAAVTRPRHEAIRAVCNSTHVGEDMEKLFVLIVLNARFAWRRALKNFGCL